MDGSDKKPSFLRDTYDQLSDRRAKNNRKSGGLNSDNFGSNANSDSDKPINKSSDTFARRGEKAKSAASGLSNLENTAANSLPLKTAGDLANTKQNEEDANGYYSGAGEKKKPKKGKGAASKKGPVIGIILSLVLGGGLLSFGGLSMQLISWKENIVSDFGEDSAVLNKRSNYVLRKLLHTNNDVVSQNIFRNKTKFKISSKLEKKLKTQGIDYVEADDGTRMLVYSDVDGERIPIVASDADIGRVPSSVTIGDESVSLNTGKTMTLDVAKTDLDGFKTSLDTATITFTGKVAGWFDSVTSNVLKRIGGDSPRNKTADLDNDSTEEEVDEVIYKNASDGANDSDRSRLAEETDERDEDGNPIRREYDIEEGDDILKVGDTDPDVVESKLTSRAKAAVATASSLGNFGCMFLRAFGAISIAVGAIQTANTINFALTYLELADKTKAGDANNSYNIAENNLNKVVTTTAYNKNGEPEELTGSTTSSKGWNSAFSSTNLVDENSAEANMVNRESAAKTAIASATNGGAGIAGSIVGAIASLGSGIAAFRVCNSIQLISSIFGGAIEDVMDVIGLFTTGGIANAIKTVIKGIGIKAIVAAVMGAGVGLIVGLITPLVASWLGSNLKSVFQGTVGGTALLSGGHAVQDSNLQASTGVYADKEGAIELYAMTRDVETEWAEYERNTKSPFDASSQYTFLGSLVNKMTPMLNKSGNSVVSTASNMAGLASNSLVSLVSDTASAANEVNDYAVSLASDENCPSLTSVGVAGDFACNKYSGAYVNELTTVDSTEVYDWMATNTDPDGRDFFVKDGGEVRLNSEGNPVINANSDYGYYLVACVSNDVQPGTMSSAVEGFIEKHTSPDSVAGNALLNFGLSFIPGSDLLDGIEAAEAIKNEKWNSGLACTGNTGDAAVDEEVRYFSMYNLDQRVLENMGIIEKSSTTAFLEDYYEENPIDNNSLEGILAHYGGLNNEEVDYVVGLIEYADFIANYDPSTRYAFGAPVVEIESTTLEFDNENVLGGEFILLNQIAYTDIRNRTVVA